MGEKLSIVIPVYNVEPYLRRCLDSVVNQTCRDLEIIVVEDGSPDNCGAICDEYATKDARMRVVHKQNAGVSAARNDGIRLATGDWITFVDADDWLETDYVEKMFASMPAEPVDILCCSGYIEESFCKPAVMHTFPEPFVDTTGEKKTFLIAKVMAKYCGMENRKDCGDSIAVWTRFYKTEFLQKKVPGFDKRLHPMEDLLYSLQVFVQAQAVAAVECLGYHYRKLVPTAATSRFNPTWPFMFDIYEESVVDFIAQQRDRELLWEAFCYIELASTGSMLRCYFFHSDNPASYTQVAREIRQFKKKPYVSMTLNSKSNRFLSRQHIVLKYCLRLPCVWPLKALCFAWRISNHVKTL